MPDSGETVIRVAPQVLKEKAERISAAVLDMEKAYQSAKTAAEGSGSYWQGAGGDSFRTMFGEREEEAEAVFSELRSLPRGLTGIAGNVEKTENTITEANTALPNDPLGE